MNLRKRRAKIICTLGPATNTYEKICELARAGMDVARLNFSHGTHEEHKIIFDIVRQVSRDLDRPIGILQDLQGPKIRIKEFENGHINITQGQQFIITVDDVIGNDERVSVSYKNFHRDVKAGDPILLDDGEIKLIAEKIVGNDVHCTVAFGGILKNHKGVNLPGTDISLKALTEKDKEDLHFGVELGVDYVALSFVQKPKDVVEINNEIAKLGADTPIIAKIEKPQAVLQIDEITDIVDGIMIARGDLGVEMCAEEVPPIQKQIIDLCNKKGIPVITATQMLDSMIQNPRPTRAEASDVANAILDGSDAVMLSGETSVGAFPVETVKTMNNIVTLIEQRGIFRKNKRKTDKTKEYSTPFAIGCSTYYASELVKADYILCLTQSGSTARIISRFRPSKPIIALTPHRKTLDRTCLFWGVVGIIVEDFHVNIDNAIENILANLKKNEVLKVGDKVVITGGLPFAKRRGTNMLRIEEIE